MSHTRCVTASISLAVLAMLGGACATAPEPAAPAIDNLEFDAARTLDTFHRAAATADEDTYFHILALDGVFLGTDATERWSTPAFREFAEEYFKRDSAWTYVPFERHVDVSRDGKWAWFDELLRNKTLGVCRGSGVMRRAVGRWEIVQYNLSMPVPNAIAEDVARQVRELDASAP
ncbi:MAG: nuclear transport factor 2 family protein [Phycisphaerales bacterium]|jgi:hypothetical protein|nr:nuclear transport factor 2 family protein [Phycisphaerales bacterium]